MVRRTITLPDTLDARVRETADEGESFSAAVSRLLEAGLAAKHARPAWIGSGDSGDPELSRRVEEVLDEIFSADDFKH